MRRAVLAALPAALLLTACGGGEPVVEPVPSPAPEPVVVAEPEPEPEPELDPGPVAPLTGVAVDDPAALERPVLAVKIDNAPPARPQQSLELADVVIEELVEGGTTRFLALYHSTDPGTVGPVRSGREVDTVLLPAFAPVVAISGAAPPVWDDFRRAGLRAFEEGQAGGAFFRERERRAPHNLFATAVNLWESGEGLPVPREPLWAFDADLPQGGDPAGAVDVRFPAASARWTWDPAAGWVRDQDGRPHLVRSGEVITAANVVVMRVSVRSGSRVDSTGAATADIMVVGEGDGLVLRDGRAYPIRWRKAGADDQLEWLTLGGDPFPLAPGRTWIELHPTGGGLVVQAPPEDVVAAGDRRRAHATARAAGGR